VEFDHFIECSGMTKKIALILQLLAGHDSYDMTVEYHGTGKILL